MQHRQTVMNGQIHSLHFIMISFAVSHCLSPQFVSSSCCFILHSPVFFFSIIYPSVWSWKTWKTHFPLFSHSSRFPCVCLPTLPSILPIFQSLHPHHPVLWWGAGWPWIPLLLWGNNRPSLLLSIPFSPNKGPQSTGKEGARGTGNTSRVCGREGEWESERGIK